MTGRVKRFFQDENGRYVVMQPPNGPAYLVFASVVLTKMTAATGLHRLFESTAFGAIFLWSSMEITSGESPFRRTFGAGVMAWLLGKAAARR